MFLQTLWTRKKWVSTPVNKLYRDIFISAKLYLGFYLYGKIFTFFRNLLDTYLGCFQQRSFLPEQVVSKPDWGDKLSPVYLSTTHWSHQPAHYIGLAQRTKRKPTFNWKLLPLTIKKELILQHLWQKCLTVLTSLTLIFKVSSPKVTLHTIRQRRGNRFGHGLHAVNCDAMGVP